MAKRYQRKILNGKELRIASEKGLPVFYEQYFHNPHDRSRNFKGVCVMKKATAKNSYFIGDSDIDITDYRPDQPVCSDLIDSVISVKSVEGISYES